MTEDNNEDRYEHIDMIIKTREDGQNWFDVIEEFISKDCQGDPESEENTCTCGLESMGGCVGTLDQCYRHAGIADDLVGPVNKEDLLLVLEFFFRSSHLKTLDEYEAAKRLHKECTWWDETLARWAEESEEDDEEEDETNL